MNIPSFKPFIDQKRANQLLDVKTLNLEFSCNTDLDSIKSKINDYDREKKYQQIGVLLKNIDLAFQQNILNFDSKAVLENIENKIKKMKQDIVTKIRSGNFDKELNQLLEQFSMIKKSYQDI